jgi:hypothetical protein
VMSGSPIGGHIGLRQGEANGPKRESARMVTYARS